MKLRLLSTDSALACQRQQLAGLGLAVNALQTCTDLSSSIGGLNGA